MYNPSEDSTDTTPPPARSSNPNARYAYLVGRLRSRQITMEEATELFSLQQAALSRSEAGRMAAIAQSGSARASSMAPPPPPPTPVVSGAAGADDLLILGLLTMGAGAGLMAAMARKMQEPPSPPASATASSESKSSK
jgi:hypothetical protein